MTQKHEKLVTKYADLKRRSKGSVKELQSALTRLAEEKGTLQLDHNEALLKLRETEAQLAQFKELFERERQERDKLSVALTQLMA